MCYHTMYRDDINNDFDRDNSRRKISMGKRMRGRFLAGILAAALLCTAIPQTAYAADGFVPRTTDPGNNSNYTDGNPYAKFAGTNNCTYYAWGRARELLGYRPHVWEGNAGDWWYNNDGYARGSTPRLGAIMCWGPSGDAVGHVAVVEAIHGDGRISFSEASYIPSYAFAYQTKYISELSNIYRGIFQGYIYLPGVPVSPAPSPDEEGSDMQAPFTRTIADGDYHIVTALDDNMCLDIEGASQENGANAQIWHGTEDELQVFTVTWLGTDKGYKIILRNSGKSLDVAGRSRKNGTNVWQWEHFNPSEHTQDWVINEVDNGAYYTIQSRGSGFYLDVDEGIAADGTNVKIWKGNGGTAQKWRFIPAGTQTIPNGDYYIMSDVGGNMCLDAEAKENGDDSAIIARKTGQESQIYTVSYLANGFYKIFNKNSGKSLDVYLGETTRGANVCLWSGGYNGGHNQQWTIRESGGGSYYIQPRNSGHYLDVANGSAAEGTNVWTTAWMGGAAAQKWKFLPCSLQKLDPPTATSPSGAEVEAGTGIGLSCGVTGASIYYTINGADPTRQSALYIDPIIVTENMTIRAIAVKEGYQDSDVAVFTYTVKQASLEDPEKPDDPSQPEEEIPEEDIPESGVIPDGLWVAGLAEDGYAYTGGKVKPKVRVYDHRTPLKEKTDYTISYKNNTAAYGFDATDPAFDAKKAPTIIVTAKGNYSGKETLPFRILPLDINSSDFAADDMSIACKKRAQRPNPILMWGDRKLKNHKDYTTACYFCDGADKRKVEAVSKPGVYEIRFTGKGNFTGVRQISLSVTDSLKLISKANVARIPKQSYTGGAVMPALTVKYGGEELKEGEDYTVSYSKNTEVGTAYAIVAGIEEAGYSGTKRVSFQISGTPIKKATVEGLEKKEFYYDGMDITPQLTLHIGMGGQRTLTQGKDYTVAWQKNRNAGTASVVFTGKGAYTGTLKKTFQIGKFDIAANADGRFTVRLDQEEVPYTKGGAKPKVTVTFKGGNGFEQILKEGEDYTLTYRNHTAVNDGSNLGKRPTVTVVGKGNFKGTYKTKLTYRIAARDIGALTLTAADRTYQNKKNAFATKVTITDSDGRALSVGKDYNRTYTYTYKEETIVKNGAAVDGAVIRASGDVVKPGDIIPAGTVLIVTVTAKEGGNYTGKITGEYRIIQASISSASVSVLKQIYTGRPITLDRNQIMVRRKGKRVDPNEYEIVPGSYKNNVKKGTASVKIRGVGNYGGIKTVTFVIRAKKFVWWT